MQESSSSHQDLADMKSSARLLMKLNPSSLGVSRQEFASVFSHSKAELLGSEQATKSQVSKSLSCCTSMQGNK